MMLSASLVFLFVVLALGAMLWAGLLWRAKPVEPPSSPESEAFPGSVTFDDEPQE